MNDNTNQPEPSGLREFRLSFGSAFGAGSGLLLALVGLPILCLIAFYTVRWLNREPEPIIVPVAVPIREPAPQKPLAERAIDAAEVAVRDRLQPNEGAMLGRGVIVESDAYGTYMVVGKTDSYTEWKVRLGVESEGFRIAVVMIDGEDRTDN